MERMILLYEDYRKMYRTLGLALQASQVHSIIQLDRSPSDLERWKKCEWWVDCFKHSRTLHVQLIVNCLISFTFSRDLRVQTSRRFSLSHCRIQCNSNGSRKTVFSGWFSDHLNDLYLGIFTRVIIEFARNIEVDLDLKAQSAEPCHVVMSQNEPPSSSQQHHCSTKTLVVKISWSIRLIPRIN